jgi:hypothetical protein
MVQQGHKDFVYCNNCKNKIYKTRRNWKEKTFDFNVTDFFLCMDCKIEKENKMYNRRLEDGS